uniref:FHA domain-containing protein n=1 Tax=Candidatus Desulfatibia profunda TaxID=2841695 RepID=A0A8J6NLX9_9BACT|nr:FHA domain-containing protein [Candidatus Desulfatibia profunda]
MKKTVAVFIWFALLFLAAVSWNYAQLEAKEEVVPSEFRSTLQELDIVLVLDNSGSMKANDPKFLTREVVTNFMVGFGAKSRLAMIIFGREARLVEPLTDVSGLVARANFLKSFEQVNYKGLFSDSPAAVERAVYELKLNGRINARKVIILLTDGIVDTGDKAQDLEKTKWLKEDLAQECSNAGIRIFGVAFTDKADFSLIQTLAFKTGAEYFRAYAAEDIQKIFNKISQLINKLPSAAAAGAATSIPVPSPAVSVSPERLAAKSHVPPLATAPVAAPQKIPAQIKKTGSILLIFLIGIFVLLAAIFVIMALNRKNKTLLGAVAGHARWGRQEFSMPRAELIDVKNVTDQKTVELSKPLIRIGRDTSNDVTIPTDTVSSLHATIEYRNGFFYLEDQRSKNKTYLNGDEIPPYSPMKLKSGDVITINVHKFIFILPDLIPAGETVLDLSGKTEAQAQEATILRRQVVSMPDASARPQAMLIDVKNVTGKKTVLLDKSLIKIGRGVHNDVAIDQHSVSGSHATIQYKDGSYYLEDQRSKNKTRLNGEEIGPNTPIKLKSGDEIVFDIYKFIFLLEQQTPSGDTDENW